MNKLTVNNLVVAVEALSDTQGLLGKVAPLVGRDADIHVVRVVYDGFAQISSKHIAASDKLKHFVLECEQPRLEAAIQDSETGCKRITSETLLHPHSWEAITEVVAQRGAELVVKQLAEGSNELLLQTPEDWNLLRHSPVPVLLTKGRPWPGKPKVVAAIDVYDPKHKALNQAVLKNAKWVSAQVDAELHVVSVFPMLANWTDNVTASGGYDNLRANVEKEVIDNANEACRQADLGSCHVHALEGVADLEINKLVNGLTANILVLGTKARSGIRALILGNTAERILYGTRADVLTVP